MLERIDITAETRVRVLAFRGLKGEYYQGVPEVWIECFGVDNEMDPEFPTFDQILYLRNMNICPTASETMEAFFPIWHAAVITFKDGKPVTKCQNNGQSHRKDWQTELCLHPKDRENQYPVVLCLSCYGCGT